MNFFKKLFSTTKIKENVQQPNSFSETRLSDIATEEYFNNRYKKDAIDVSILDGALKMIESYFIENKLEKKIKEPINHPQNLDQTIDDGFGFVLFCKAYNMEEKHALMFLSLAFNDFMIKNYGFKLYKDSEPEFPLRTMTLKYDNKGAKLSLYPIEYTTKVLNYESSFEDLHIRIQNSLENIPTSDDVYNKLMSSLDDK